MAPLCPQPLSAALQLPTAGHRLVRHRSAPPCTALLCAALGAGLAPPAAAAPPLCFYKKPDTCQLREIKACRARAPNKRHCVPLLCPGPNLQYCKWLRCQEHECWRKQSAPSRMFLSSRGEIYSHSQGTLQPLWVPPQMLFATVDPNLSCAHWHCCQPAAAPQALLPSVRAGGDGAVSVFPSEHDPAVLLRAV